MAKAIIFILILIAIAPLLCGGVEGDKEGSYTSCGAYLAKSTIPGAGLGVFTGVPHKNDEYIGSDPAIPLIDLDFHAGSSMQKEDYHWLPSEYVWKATTMGQEMENEAEVVSSFVPGFGSMPNCHLKLTNIAEFEVEKYDYAGIGKGRTDPGVGAFTPYHSRATYTTKDVVAGQELFVDYGESWFTSREVDMGPLPLRNSYPFANRFIKSFEKLVEKVTKIAQADDMAENVQDLDLEDALTDLYDVIIQFPFSSRPQSALPKSFSDAKRAFDVGIDQLELEQSIRSIDWLNENGRCLDNIRTGNSTLPHARRGTFARIPIPKDGYIHINPLLHIPDRDVLTMYEEKHPSLWSTDESERDLSKPTGHQLLLNYCFGHRSSSLLLCPYSNLFINHSSDSPNAKIVWSSDLAYHNPSWLEKPVSFFDNVWSTSLSFEYVAIKDINEGDEILIDYGNEWQEAWTKHLQQWQEPENADKYISAQQLNGDLSLPIPTYDEHDTLLDENIEVWCHLQHLSPIIEDDQYEWTEDDEESDEIQVERIIDRIMLDDKAYVYKVLLVDETTVTNVPRKALSFTQQMYGSDMFLKEAFRHHIEIPDEIFPDAWQNL